jgi:hypothetical protein
MASSCFFLFGYIKGKLFDYNRKNREDLLNVITEIDQEVLLTVVESRINRLKRVMKYEKNYYTESRKNKRHFFKIGRENGRIRIYGPFNPIPPNWRPVFRATTTLRKRAPNRQSRPANEKKRSSRSLSSKLPAVFNSVIHIWNPDHIWPVSARATGQMNHFHDATSEIT